MRFLLSLVLISISFSFCFAEDLSLKCELCDLAVNEIEGLANENISMTDIQTALENDICSQFPESAAELCDSLVEQLPRIIFTLERGIASVSEICNAVGACTAEWGPREDPFEIPEYTIDLNQQPIQRWKSIASQPKYKQSVQLMVNWLVSQVGENVLKYAYEIGNNLESYLGQPFSDEIRGLSSSFNISEGLIALLNFGYELTDSCTAIIAESPKGVIYHVRNLDFGEAMGFTDVLRNLTVKVKFVRGNELVFESVTYVGYVGILTGIKPNKFAINVNTRFLPKGPLNMLETVMELLLSKNVSLNSFTIRNLFESSDNDFESALKVLSETKLVADVYNIISGPNKHQGAVITRARSHTRDIRRLNDTVWNLVQTNYDWWTEPPFWDNRATPAIDAVNKLDRNNLSLKSLLPVLNIKPVFNKLTTLTALMSVSENSFDAVGRYCNDPCPF